MCTHSLSAALALLLTCLAVVAPARAEEGSSDGLTPQEALEEDLALVWGINREEKQRREFVKDGRVEAAVFGGMIPNDDFLIYYTIGARVGYHFTESLMVEASFAKSFDQHDIEIKSAESRELVKMFYNLNVLWSPIYEKLSSLGSKLSHFDAFIGLGVGVFHNKERNSDSNSMPTDVIKPAANTVLGFRWHITDMINIRTEYRHYFFQKVARIGGVSKPVELSLGVGFLF